MTSKTVRVDAMAPVVLSMMALIVSLPAVPTIESTLVVSVRAAVQLDCLQVSVFLGKNFV
jgi:hypothetical protein